MIEAPGGSAATVGALMVGLMFVFSTESYIQSYRQMIDRWMNDSLNADLFVATSTMLRSTSYHFSEDLGRRIAALPGVSRVENVRFTAILYRGDTAAVNAIEMDGFLSRSLNAVQAADKRTVRDRLTRGEGALVSRNFAARWGVAADKVTLQSPNGPGPADPRFLDDYRSEKGRFSWTKRLQEVLE
jgi:putative ABC transport system permease protein